AVILVDCSWSGGPMPAFKFADYAISGGAQYRRPSGMSFISFLECLEPEPEIVRISYNTTRFLVRGKTVKTSETLYKQRKQYYSYGRIIQGYRMDGKVESGKIEVHYKDNPDWEQINIPKNIFLEDFADSLEQCDHIDSIVYVGIEETIEFGFDNILSDSLETEQWGLERIYAQDAWDITMGDSNIVVSVLETKGVDWSHYELGKGYDNYQNICINNGEDPWPDTIDAAGRKRYKLGGNGLDDDGDSLVDNFIGWNFRDSNKNCRTDSCQHGTMVAGIIAAKTNNGRGISGIAGGDSCTGVRILPYAFWSSTFINACGDAVRKGAKIVNMSFGTAHTKSNDSILQIACNISVVLIAAAGNDSTHQHLDYVRYPARNPYVMAVGAIDKDNRRAHFSCYGPELSVVAPGRGIRTLTKDNKFINASGTSFAAPHVTGVAALMLSVNPNLTPADVRRIIEKTARKVGGYNYHNDPQHPNGTWNEEMGYGLVDAHAAVLNVVDSTLDLYVRDSEDDNGDEPSVTTIPWNSPDIWIEDMEQNEVSSLNGLREYNVCVRIHNRADSASTGYEKLYLNWVKAGPSSDWSAAWQGMKRVGNSQSGPLLGNRIGWNDNGVVRYGHPIPKIPSGKDTVVRVRWRTPEPDYYSAFYNGSELRHFCLCARIHDGRRIVNEDADSVNMGDFVKNSSHVAWKNIIIIEGGIRQKSFLHVYTTSTKPICLRYAGCANTAGEQLHEYAEVKLKLDTGLYNVWQRGGFTGSGFVLQADSSLLLQSANAELCSLLLDTSRIYLMQTSVQFKNRLVPQNSTFHADIVQYYEYDENGIHVSELVGGEHYKAVRSGDCEYTVQIAGDTDLLQGETATFTATGAESYRWYNAGGELLGTAETMTAVPAYSQCYYLETTGGLCGYISRDTVCVQVSEGEIVTLYPNPTNDFVHLEYQITGNYNNASIQITNELGTTQQTVMLNEPQGSETLDVQELPAGAYYVLLKSPTGRVLDVKTLVKGE
ncbi:MAG: S8 family peptidase, partial [Bacteroidales bacterium]|nr:S8 family peptidase [Bacteroidales bacterium]